MVMAHFLKNNTIVNDKNNNDDFEFCSKLAAVVAVECSGHWKQIAAKNLNKTSEKNPS